MNEYFIYIYIYVCMCVLFFCIEIERDREDGYKFTNANQMEIPNSYS